MKIHAGSKDLGGTPMEFGRWKGLPVREVPIEWLAWCVVQIRKPPKYILQEVMVRAEAHGSRDSIPAAEALAKRNSRANRMVWKKRRLKNKRALQN